jgi:hypothetical protein
VRDVCLTWAPELTKLGEGSYMLAFTAQRSGTPQAACGGYDEDSGVYNAWSSSPLGPSAQHSFGHGSVVLGPDNQQLFYVHPRLRAEACRNANDCARDVYLQPLDFEDRGDGRGDVWIKTRFPSENPGVVVPLPK